MSRDVAATVGYDYILRQVNSAYANVILSIEFDYLLGVFLLSSFDFACMHPWLLTKYRYLSHKIIV